MGLFGRLLGSDKAIDSLSNAIDKSVITEEEKTDLKIEIWKAAHPFKVAQRFFMLLVVMPYMTVWCIAVGIFLHNGNKELFNILLTDRVGDVFLAMAIFYYGGGTINTINSFVRNKK